ncbi:glycosyltransferase family 4 protein [Lentisphaerota bacterium ZTH]|nr:glycosyltransferase family 4 protein [Lentisphaerota bacterium]WET07389.1 glycosyltransferase family 4 protein [Lentisphaerota bacterium ZTH]
MKVANILRRFTFEEWGGTESVVWNTSRCLVNKNCTADILCTKALAALEEEHLHGLMIRRFPYFYPYFPMNSSRKLQLDKKGGNPYCLKMLEYLRDSEYDILHCHTMERLADCVKLAAEIRKVPYVISFHGGCLDVPKSELDEMMKPLNRTFNYGKIFDWMLGYNRNFIEKANGIICVGFNEYELVKKKYSNKLVEYIPNGVDDEYFSKKPTVDFKHNYNIPLDAEIILCVSRIDYQKNQKQLLELMNEIKNDGGKEHLVIIGPVTAVNYYKEMRRMIECFGLIDRVTVIEGLKPESEYLHAAYHAADVFILPSLHEPFGIVVLEAWSSGLPVISSRVGGLEKIIDDHETGLLFEPESLDGLLKAWKELKAKPDLRDKLVKQAGDTVRKYFTWDRITDKLLNFYNKVIDEFKGKS